MTVKCVEEVKGKTFSIVTNVDIVEQSAKKANTNAMKISQNQNAQFVSKSLNTPLSTISL